MKIGIILDSAGTMQWNLPFFIAHRGAPGLAPENTLPALAQAIACGAHAVEFDVQLTRDGVPVIFHDDRLERTTNGQGFLTNITYEALQKLEAGAWFSSSFVNLRVPSLEAWLACAAGAELILNAELKARTRAQAVALVKHALPILMTYPVEKMLVSSENLHCLLALKKHQAPWRLGLIIERRLTAASLRTLKRNNIVSVHQPYTLFDKEYVAWLHSQGLRALAYTVNDPSDYQALKVMGIDGVFSDNMALLQPKFGS